MKLCRKMMLLACLAALLCRLLTGAAFAAEPSVTVSFVDDGERYADEVAAGDVAYPEPLGVIVSPTRVALQEGDTIATVTLRLLESKGIGWEITGSAASNFYLAAIKNVEEPAISRLGEFDCGNQSGWMVTQNNWFINQGADAFSVEDGDVIRWQYTCRYGTDIGCDFDTKSAAITGFAFEPEEAALSPAFSPQTKAYTLTVPEDTDSLLIETLLENYWARVQYTVNSASYSYPSRIPVENGAVITVDSAWAAAAGEAPSDTDRITLTVVKSAGETPGDVNGDGAVNSTDAVLALQHAVHSITLEGGRKAAADVNGDGLVNSTDAALILQYAVHLISSFPGST